MRSTPAQHAQHASTFSQHALNTLNIPQHFRNTLNMPQHFRNTRSTPSTCLNIFVTRSTWSTRHNHFLIAFETYKYHRPFPLFAQSINTALRWWNIEVASSHNFTKLLCFTPAASPHTGGEYYDIGLSIYIRNSYVFIFLLLVAFPTHTQPTHSKTAGYGNLSFCSFFLKEEYKALPFGRSFSDFPFPSSTKILVFQEHTTTPLIIQFHRTWKSLPCERVVLVRESCSRVIMSVLYEYRIFIKKRTRGTFHLKTFSINTIVFQCYHSELSIVDILLCVKIRNTICVFPQATHEYHGILRPTFFSPVRLNIFPDTSLEMKYIMLRVFSITRLTMVKNLPKL